MPTFKSPFSKRIHAVPEYDTEDYILNNSETKERKTQDDFNNDVLTQKNWNWNRHSTRKDKYVDITLDKEQVEARSRKWKDRIYNSRKWRNY